MPTFEIKDVYSKDCSCVEWVKAQKGIKRSMGDAYEWDTPYDKPFVGAVVVTRESDLGHVGIVTDVNLDEGYIVISEKNYAPCTVTHGRKLPINSPLIEGYWYE